MRMQILYQFALLIFEGIMNGSNNVDILIILTVLFMNFDSTSHTNINSVI